MPWAKLDDDFFSHPKVLALLEEPEGWAAIGFWAAMLSWASKYTRRPGKTPGFLPRSSVSQMDRRRYTELAGLLVLHGLWECRDGGWQIHDYDRYLPSEAMRKSRAEAGRRGGLARAENAARLASSLSSGVSPENPDVASSLDTVASSQDDVATGLPTLARLKQTPSMALGTGIGRADNSPSGGTSVVGRARNQRGTRIPEDFKVTTDMVKWARERCPRVDGKYETEKFVNYWRAKAGRDATKVNWVLTWQNWMLRAAENLGQMPVNGESSARVRDQAMLRR